MFVCFSVLQAYHRQSPKLMAAADAIPPETWQQLSASLRPQQQQEQDDGHQHQHAVGLALDQQQPEDASPLQQRQLPHDPGGIQLGHLQHQHDVLVAAQKQLVAPQQLSLGGQHANAAQRHEKETLKSSTAIGVPGGASGNAECAAHDAEAAALAAAEAVAAEAAVHAQVKSQVRSFVQSLVKPYVQSGVLEGASEKRIVLKAVDKVLAKRGGCKDAGFLLAEHSAVAKLVESLVKHSKRC